MQSPKSSVGSNKELAQVLRSSWIRRLHLKPTSSISKNRENPPPISPPAAVNPPLNQTAISTDEFRTPSSNFNAPTTPLPRQDSPSTKLDSTRCSFPGFGPFQLKNRATGSDKVTVFGEDDDHLIDNCAEDQEENVRGLVDDRRGTPMSPFFRYWPDSNKNQGFRENTEQNKFAKYGGGSQNSSIGHPMCAPPLEALAGGGSQNRRDEPCLDITGVAGGSKYCLRIGGINCQENCDNGVASRILRGHRQNVVPSRLERNVSINPNETGKASFWNMNRFRKTEVVSSMLHPCKSSTKRKTPSSFDEFACVKLRKSGHEDQG